MNSVDILTKMNTILTICSSNSPYSVENLPISIKDMIVGSALIMQSLQREEYIKLVGAIHFGYVMGLLENKEKENAKIN